LLATKGLFRAFGDEYRRLLVLRQKMTFCRDISLAAFRHGRGEIKVWGATLLAFLSFKMPKQLHEIKQFLLNARRPDAKFVQIKKGPRKTKFKVRCSRYLYTLVVTDPEKVDRLKQSLPPTVKVIDANAKKEKKAKK